MKKDLIISCDLGTSGNKATLFDSDGNLLANSFKSYDTYYFKPGWAEQNPKDWWDSVRNSTLELLEKVPHAKKNLAGISFSGQMMGCCPIGKNGEPLINVIIWSDQRAYKERELLRDKITDEYAYKTTGNVVCANYLAAKIMWLKKNHSDVYRNTYKFLQAKDFIEFILTGNTYTDYSDASGTNLFDIKNKKWSKEILSEASISGEKLPDVVPSVKIIGEVKKEIADLINLPQGLMADIWGKKIITMKYMEEATSIGAAVAALVGLGIKKDFYEAENFIKKSGEIECDPENNEVYNSYYRIFKSAYHDLKNINRALDKITKN